MSRLPLTSSHRRARAGMALALVLMMLAIAVVIGVCFLTAAGTSTPVSRLVDQRLQARMVAESGLAIALNFVQGDPVWRSTRAEGLWVDSEAFAGGTFSISGHDGEDTNGDGLIEGNGNFADDPAAPVTLNVTGQYAGIRHTVRAVYRPIKAAPVAVAHVIELRDSSMIDSYDAMSGPYGADNRGANAVVSSNSTGKPNIKLSNDAVINAGFYVPKDADATRALQISGNAKINGIIGNLAAPEVTIAPIVTPDYTPVETDVTYNSNNVTLLDRDLVCNNFNLLGSTTLKIVGDVKIICEGNFLMDNSSKIILENPRYGFDVPFGSTQNASNNQQVATLISVADEVEVRTIAAYISKAGKSFRLALYNDNAGQPGSLLVQSSTAAVLYDSPYWHELNVTPTKIAPGSYWLALSVISGAPQFSYGDGGKTVHRYHDAVTNGFLANWGVSDESYVRSVNIYLTGNVAGKGARLQVYSDGKLTVQGSASINANTQVPSRVTFWHTDAAADADGEAWFRGTTLSYATVHAPDANLRLSDWARLYGVARGRDIILEHNSITYADAAGGQTDPGVLIGETLTMRDYAKVEGWNGTAAVVTCAVGSPVIWVKGISALKGDAYGGPGGAGGNSEVQVERGATFTGRRRNLITAVPLNMPVVPSLTQVSSVYVSSGTTVFSSSFKCDEFKVYNTGTVEIRGDVTIVARNARFHNYAKLKLAPGAKLTLYVTSRFEPRDDAELNLGGDPSRLIINFTSIRRTQIYRRAKVCASVVAPAAQVSIYDDAHLYGSLLARRLKLRNRGQLHADARPARILWTEP